MAKTETENEPKDLIEVTPEVLEEFEKEAEKIEELEMAIDAEEIKRISREEKIAERERQELQDRLASWVPKTQIGRDVKEGKETNINNILANRKKILEPEIIDKLLHVESDMLSIGQAKGKFGGGKRRAWRQTQKKTKEGNILTFSAMAVIGDKKGHVGIGLGKAKETLPAREKAIRNAKLNIIKIKRGCANFDCSCNEEHTVPYTVEGKAGSVRVTLIPAPQGSGLVIGDEGKKILRFAGIRDVYSKNKGKVQTTFNLAKAIMNALEKTTKMEK